MQPGGVMEEGRTMAETRLKKKSLHELRKHIGRLKELAESGAREKEKKAISAAVLDIESATNSILSESEGAIEGLFAERSALEVRKNELEEFVQELLVVLKASRLLRDAENQNDVMASLKKIAGSIIPVTEFEVFLSADAEEWLVPLVREGGSEKLRTLVREHIEDGILEWVMAGDDIRIMGGEEILNSGIEIRANSSFLYVPLLSGKERIGLLVFEAEVEKQAIKRQKLELLRLITDQVSSALEKVVLRMKLHQSERILNQYKRISAEPEREITARDW